MEYKEFEALFCPLAKINKIKELDSKAIYRLYKLEKALSEANKVHNLTAIKDTKGVIVKHFIDSIMLENHIAPSASIIDVGCGAGFPSLPLAISREDLDITAIDSTAKKVDYVNRTAKLLYLQNLRAASCRAEELAFEDEFREAFDIATARAVAALPVLAELCLPFVKVGGYFIAMKAQNADAELEAAVSAIEKCGGAIEEKIDRELYSHLSCEEYEKRSLIIIKKVKNTPQIYPRIYSKIIKKPL